MTKKKDKKQGLTKTNNTTHIYIIVYIKCLFSRELSPQCE